jgi:hypothetical protein
MLLNRTSGLSRKVSWTALYDRCTSALAAAKSMTFDDSSPAPRQRLGYRRFAAEAIRFAVEEYRP